MKILNYAIIPASILSNDKEEMGFIAAVAIAALDLNNVAEIAAALNDLGIGCDSMNVSVALAKLKGAANVNKEHLTVKKPKIEFTSLEQVYQQFPQYPRSELFTVVPRIIRWCKSNNMPLNKQLIIKLVNQQILSKSVGVKNADSNCSFCDGKKTMKSYESGELQHVPCICTEA